MIDGGGGDGGDGSGGDGRQKNIRKYKNHFNHMHRMHINRSSWNLVLLLLPLLLLRPNRHNIASKLICLNVVSKFVFFFFVIFLLPC